SGAEAIVVHGESPGSGRSRAPRSLARPFVHLAPLDAPGWQGLTSRALLKLLDRWEEGGVDVAVAEIKATGVDQTLAASLAHQLLAKGRPHMIRQGRSLDVFPRAVSEELIKSVMKLASVEVQGETDAPVTTDIHRLIRWPGSLHGGSGLRVLPISRDELDRFEPLREAVPESNGSARVRVELTETVRLPVGEGTLAGSAGERLDLEAPAATFLMLRGEARLAPAPPG
ncbi:MAG TPA: hypothetical protein VGU43_05900, partial [Thermoplasmata archaeon]|nr:hypothetical protein [Thermoplasmata archaeon]